MKHKKLTQHKIDLLSRQMCNMTEQQQIEKLLLEANAYGLRNTVEQVAQLSIWGSTRLDKYQDAYLNVIYGTKENLQRIYGIEQNEL